MKKYLKLSLLLLLLFTNTVFAKSIKDVTINDSRFNLNDYGLITGLKDQRPHNTCWTFGTTASVESSILFENKYGYTKDLDLSEAHIEVATSKDYNIFPTKRVFKTKGGGTHRITSAYYFQRVGPVFESDFEYSNLSKIENGAHSSINNIITKFSVNDEIILKNTAGQPCSSNTINTIKNYLIHHGAMYAGINGGLCKKGVSYNGIHYYCYNNSSKKYTHQVAIVGWDDTIPISNFPQDNKPTTQGAFIIKNSGSGGRFEYRSYEDVMMCYFVGGYYNIDIGVEDNVYAYDTPGVNDYSTSFSNNKDYFYVANKYSKTNNLQQKLEKVTIYSYYNNQPFEIYYSSTGNLEKLTKLYSGKTDHIGYSTVKLNNTIITNKDFAVAIKYYPVGKENKIPLYRYKESDIYFNLQVKPNYSFMSSDGVNWNNFASSSHGNYYASIKVYTNNIQPKKYTVNYSYDDGISSNTKTYDYCETTGNECYVTLPNISLKEGKKFLGCFFNNEKLSITNNKIKLTKDMIIYAKTEDITPLPTLPDNSSNNNSNPKIDYAIIIIGTLITSIIILISFFKRREKKQNIIQYNIDNNNNDSLNLTKENSDYSFKDEWKIK